MQFTYWPKKVHVQASRGWLYFSIKDFNILKMLVRHNFLLVLDQFVFVNRHYVFLNFLFLLLYLKSHLSFQRQFYLVHCYDIQVFQSPININLFIFACYHKHRVWQIAYPNVFHSNTSFIGPKSNYYNLKLRRLLTIWKMVLMKVIRKI